MTQSPNAVKGPPLWQLSKGEVRTNGGTRYKYNVVSGGPSGPFYAAIDFDDGLPPDEVVDEIVALMVAQGWKPHMSRDSLEHDSKPALFFVLRSRPTSALPS